MKRLHRDDLFMWSRFDDERDLDFNSVAWRPPDGCVVVDPLPLTAHDEAHLRSLGGVSWIVITNSDHTRAAVDVRSLFRAKVAAPAAERAVIEAKLSPVVVDRWLNDGEVVVDGMTAFALDGSKTPGELALLIVSDREPNAGRTLITGDLVRAPKPNALAALPRAKLADAVAARASIERLASLAPDVVVVGDGWPLFSDATASLRVLAATF